MGLIAGTGHRGLGKQARISTAGLALLSAVALGASLLVAGPAFAVTANTWSSANSELVSQGGAWYPKIGYLPSGQRVVVAAGRNSGSGNGNGLAAWVGSSPATGPTWIVGDPSSAFDGTKSVAGNTVRIWNTVGGVVATWMAQGSNGSGIRYLGSSAFNGSAWSTPDYEPIATDLPRALPGFAQAPNGSISVAWADRLYAMQFLVVTTAGIVGTPVALNASLAPGAYMAPSVVVDSAGTSWVGFAGTNSSVIAPMAISVTAGIPSAALPISAPLDFDSDSGIVLANGPGGVGGDVLAAFSGAPYAAGHMYLSRYASGAWPATADTIATGASFSESAVLSVSSSGALALVYQNTKGTGSVRPVQSVVNGGSGWSGPTTVVPGTGTLSSVAISAVVGDGLNVMYAMENGVTNSAIWSSSYTPTSGALSAPA